MNRILLICLFAAAFAFGEETNLSLTVDGITYSNVHFRGTTPATVTIFHSTGVATIPLEKLPPELQERFGYDPQRAAQWQAAQQKATEEQQRNAAAAAERESKIASAVAWQLTIEHAMVDGVIAKGCKTAQPCLQPFSIFLVEHPQQANLAEGNKLAITAYRDGVAEIMGRTLEKWVYCNSYEAQSSAANKVLNPQARETSAPQYVRIPSLKFAGAFGFPQQQSKVLCNRTTFRFSVWNNAKYLFAQAVIWMDNDSSLGKNTYGNPVGDWSNLMLDLDDNGKSTADVDRIYLLNPQTYLGGLRYEISKGAGRSTGLMADSEGRGAIRYVQTADGQRVRVDTYLIPLEDLARRVGDKIGICYGAYSPKPQLCVNSVSFSAGVRPNKYCEYVLVRGDEIDATLVPDDRNP